MDSQSERFRSSVENLVCIALSPLFCLGEVKRHHAFGGASFHQDVANREDEWRVRFLPNVILYPASHGVSGEHALRREEVPVFVSRCEDIVDVLAARQSHSGLDVSTCQAVDREIEVVVTSHHKLPTLSTTL